MPRFRAGSDLKAIRLRGERRCRGRLRRRRRLEVPRLPRLRWLHRKTVAKAPAKKATTTAREDRRRQALAPRLGRHYSQQADRTRPGSLHRVQALAWSGTYAAPRRGAFAGRDDPVVRRRLRPAASPSALRHCVAVIQLVAAEAISFMIDKRAGCRTDAHSNRHSKIGFGVDITASVGNRRSDRLCGQTHCARGVVSGSRPTPK